jgi:branched-chain amino acid transport system permease protein
MTSRDASYALLQVESVRAKLGKAVILQGASLALEQGEFVGVIGPNGSGKTTFFNVLSGFVPMYSGTIHLKGQSIGKWPSYQRARLGLGRVFQNSGVFREMTVLENMLTAIESREGLWRSILPWSRYTRRYRDEVAQSLERVGLLRHINSSASSLSGGQLRLLEIARTLAGGADVLLLDEPTAGVSPRMKEELASVLLALRQQGKTALIIEHDINFIEQIVGRIAVFDSGRVVLEGTAREIQQSPMLQEIYFGAKVTAVTG